METTLTLTAAQIAMLQQALGIAVEQFGQLAVRCRQMGDTRCHKDLDLLASANRALETAANMTDLMHILKAVSNG